MDEKTRIEKDIVMFEENLQKTNDKKDNIENNKIIKLANQYYEDSKYYLEKNDYFTLCQSTLQRGQGYFPKHSR